LLARYIIRAARRKKLKFHDIKFSRRGILKFTGKTLGFKIPPLRNSKFRNIKFYGAEFQNLACTDKILRNFIGAMPHKLQS